MVVFSFPKMAPPFWVDILICSHCTSKYLIVERGMTFQNLATAESSTDPMTTIGRVLKKPSSTRDLAAVKGWVRKLRKPPEGPLADIVFSHWFEVICALAILLNAASLAVSTNHSATNAIASQAEMPSTYVNIDLAFCIWFTVELLLRVLAENPFRFWYRSGLLGCCIV